MRFRHFTGLDQELDDDISEWIQLGADIHFMSHSQQADGRLTVCFVYQEGFAAQERRLTAGHGLHESPAITLPPEPVHVESEGVE